MARKSNRRVRRNASAVRRLSTERLEPRLLMAVNAWEAATVNGLISTAGETDTYTLTLSSARTRMYFDALTNDGNFRWSLAGPTGAVVDSRPFTSSDGQNIGNPILNLPGGAY